VLAAQLDLSNDFGIWGIVKETGVDDMGIAQFQRDYFPYPLYCDKSYDFYRALGDRKVTLQFALNPLALFDVLCNAMTRFREKGVDGNFTGEGVTQGGIIFFDSDGNPVYAYEEQTGSDVPIRDVVAVVNKMREDSRIKHDVKE
jgi:AhpC/TSA antioxidant enzyme